MSGILVAAPRISVVIPTFQRCALLRECLDALANQTALDEFEVVVSVDGSDDGTVEMLAAETWPYPLRHVCLAHGGRAAACNAGVRLAHGNLMILLDDDMAPAPGLLAAHARAHDGAAHRGVVGAAPVRIADCPTPVTRYIAAKFDRHLAKVGAPGYALTFRDFYSGNFSIRRDTLLGAGGFDEGFKAYGNEDGELALRLQARGVELVYDPTALAWQRYVKSFANLARDNLEKGQTAVHLARRHPTASSLLKLATYHEGSAKWRALRGAFLVAGARWPTIPRSVIALVTLVERAAPDHVSTWYEFALDFFFWLGVRSVMPGGRPNPAPSRPLREQEAHWPSRAL